MIPYEDTDNSMPQYTDNDNVYLFNLVLIFVIENDMARYRIKHVNDNNINNKRLLRRKQCVFHLISGNRGEELCVDGEREHFYLKSWATKAT